MYARAGPRGAGGELAQLNRPPSNQLKSLSKLQWNSFLSASPLLDGFAVRRGRAFRKKDNEVNAHMVDSSTLLKLLS